ncbi:hypothetical protein [Bradyrhizobium sp. ISRA463]|uniref:hypothetical protein n=1 Tax=Bradyrhizobium sp. ISRA463 TaxID=2866199 RepID=UPI00247A49B1|nr:hypothetical protein [Bradyrhizobium sp. ISRA463]WGS22136.1 hypothetical protein MTX22_10870 [Bradyrhizobium sp. ISRA463]
MERSEIRGSIPAEKVVPDYATLDPGHALAQYFGRSARYKRDVVPAKAGTHTPRPWQ